jgi:hypothetical protein
MSGLNTCQKCGHWHGGVGTEPGNPCTHYVESLKAECGCTGVKAPATIAAQDCIPPAAVTDHSSYELGVSTERERCIRIAEAEQSTYDCERYNEMNGYNAARYIAAAIRSGK